MMGKNMASEMESVLLYRIDKREKKSIASQFTAARDDFDVTFIDKVNPDTIMNDNISLYTFTILMEMPLEISF